MQKNKIKVVKKTLQERKTATVFREKKTVFAGAVIANNPDHYPKTGEWKFLLPQVKVEECIGCGICEKFCPEGVINVKKTTNSSGAKAQIELDFCKGCGICSQVCPKKAIVMESQ